MVIIWIFYLGIKGLIWSVGLKPHSLSRPLMLSVAQELDIIGDFLNNPTFTYRSFSLRWCWEISCDMVLCLDPVFAMEHIWVFASWYLFILKNSRFHKVLDIWNESDEKVKIKQQTSPYIGQVLMKSHFICQLGIALKSRESGAL